MQNTVLNNSDKIPDNNVKRPLVTVGIPCYNVERFIGFAIRSVLNQTYTNFELIIIDDGSTDRTVDIIKQFDDHRIKLIVDGENRGISYRLNQQIDMAQGVYFVRMDGDDIMFPNRIADQIQYLEEHPDVTIVSSESVVINDDNNIIGIRGRDTEPVQLTYEKWLDGMRLLHPAVTGRIDYFRKYKYIDKYKGVEDADLWFRSCNECKLISLPTHTMFYRDPLKLKLSTYLFRIKQAIKSRLGYYREGYIPLKNLIKLLYYRIIKGVAYTILYALNQDSKLLAKRNLPLSDSELNQYSELLKAAIK